MIPIISLQPVTQLYEEVMGDGDLEVVMRTDNTQLRLWGVLQP